MTSNERHETLGTLYVLKVCLRNKSLPWTISYRKVNIVLQMHVLYNNHNYIAFPVAPGGIYNKVYTIRDAGKTLQTFLLNIGGI